MSAQPLAVGDQVTWTHSRLNGKTIHFSTRNGEITGLLKCSAVAKMRNGKKVILPFARFRKVGYPTEVTEFFQSLAEAVASEGGAA